MSSAHSAVLHAFPPGGPRKIRALLVGTLWKRLIDGVEVRLGDLIRDTCYRGFGRGTNTEQDV